VRHVACANPECVNCGAPYFDFEPDATIVLCPHCNHATTRIATPDLAAPQPAVVEGGE
jgi:uncharacterized Zn finger protein (UPF0148 family)